MHALVVLAETASEPTIWGMTRGDFAVAAGTLLLALTTGVLALVTWKDVKDTHRLAVIAQEAHVARYEPFVWQSAPRVVSARNGILLRVGFDLRNVGVGPAMAICAWPVAHGDINSDAILNFSDPPRPTGEMWEMAMLLPGDSVEVDVDVSELELLTGSVSTLVLCGNYTDRTQRDTTVQWLW